jgi:Protein of unknown function (DUF2637)
VATPDRPWRATAATTAVLVAALLGVAAVWGLSAWWSFAEQTAAADHLHFRHPAVLPWTLDGLACALALTAFAAALDSRPAVAARLGVFAALSGSVWSNGLGVHIRAAGLDDEKAALLVAVIVPLSAFIAFEVLLGQVRRLVFRWRGLPAPAPLPTLRVTRLLLAPRKAFGEWRRAVLDVTDPLIVVGPADVAVASLPSGSATPDAGVAVPPVGGASPTTAPAAPPGAGADALATRGAASVVFAGASDPPAPDRPAPTLDGPDVGRLTTRDVPPRPESAVAGVYRLFAADGVLLYVGCSMNIKDRVSALAGSPWWGEVDRIEVRWFGDLDAAADAELDAIRSERPVHNSGMFRYQSNRYRISAADSRRRKAKPHPVKASRPKPDWRKSDWSAVAQARGIERSQAFNVIKAEGEAAVRAARQQLAAASAPLNGQDA